MNNWKICLKNFLEDFEDFKIAEKNYAKYVANGKKSVDLSDLSKELGIKLNNYNTQKTDPETSSG